MLDVIITLLRRLLSASRGRKNLVAENLILRHQLMVIHRQVIRARLINVDRGRYDRTPVRGRVVRRLLRKSGGRLRARNSITPPAIL